MVEKNLIESLLHSSEIVIDRYLLRDTLLLRTNTLFVHFLFLMVCSSIIPLIFQTVGLEIVQPGRRYFLISSSFILTISATITVLLAAQTYTLMIIAETEFYDHLMLLTEFIVLVKPADFETTPSEKSAKLCLCLEELLNLEIPPSFAHQRLIQACRIKIRKYFISLIKEQKPAT